MRLALLVALVLIASCNKSPRSEPVSGWYCVWGEDSACSCFHEGSYDAVQGTRHRTCQNHAFGEDHCWTTSTMQGLDSCVCNREHFSKGDDGYGEIDICPPKHP